MDFYPLSLIKKREGNNYFPSNASYFDIFVIVESTRVRPIPGMIPIPGTDTRYRYQVPIPGIGICMKKIGMNPVSVRYGRYGGYRYRFGIDMGDIGIGNPVSYRVF